MKHGACGAVTLRRMHWIRLFALIVASVALSGCYYAHLAAGQWSLLRGQQSVDKLLAQPDLPAEQRAKLETVQRAREYAHLHLLLPDNGSYTRYKALDRRYTVWNVFAAPALSLEPKTWCHLIVGCLAYRGYFDEQRAEAEAARLADEGWDTYVGGVTAYSTLGWFEDPVLDIMLRWSEPRLAGLIFHEISHQMLFVEGDTTFNESYASFVELQGLRAYLTDQPEQVAQVERQLAVEAQFTELVQAARADLQSIYAGPGSESERLAAKQQRIEQLRADYRRLRDQAWNGYSGYDRWFAEDLNNAKLAPVALYKQWLPAFERLFELNHRNWALFHLAAGLLAGMEPAAREQALRELVDEQL